MSCTYTYAANVEEDCFWRGHWRGLHRGEYINDHYEGIMVEMRKILEYVMNSGSAAGVGVWWGNAFPMDEPRLVRIDKTLGSVRLPNKAISQFMSIATVVELRKCSKGLSNALNSPTATSFYGPVAENPNISKSRSTTEISFVNIQLLAIV